MNTMVYLILIIVALLAGMVILPQFMIRLAIRSVIKIFRRANAVDAGNAKSLDELGLKPKPFPQRMASKRDYKPYALNILMTANVIRKTEEEKLYLSEEDLLRSRWSGH